MSSSSRGLRLTSGHLAFANVRNPHSAERLLDSKPKYYLGGIRKVPTGFAVLHFTRPESLQLTS
jgi:hypothetical protein